jgi:natural product precursor
MKNLKLNKLNSEVLSSEQQQQIRGGEYWTCGGDNFPHYSCGCGCNYANSGGSSTAANFSANRSSGLWSRYIEGTTVIEKC